VRELISVVSFIMALFGGLAAMYHNEKDKQTMAAIVAGAFLIFFFINVRQESI
jgi:hypothetical protein